MNERTTQFLTGSIAFFGCCGVLVLASLGLYVLVHFIIKFW
jgi:hypothetical protein